MVKLLNNIGNHFFFLQSYFLKKNSEEKFFQLDIHQQFTHMIVGIGFSVEAKMF